MKPVSFMRTAPCPTIEGEDGATYCTPLSLDALVVARPVSTFFVRVGEEVDDPDGLGVTKGDLLVVDRAVAPSIGKLVLVVLEGELAVRRFTEHSGTKMVVGGMPGRTHVLDEQAGVSMWGVVIAIVRAL